MGFLVEKRAAALVPEISTYQVFLAGGDALGLQRPGETRAVAGLGLTEQGGVAQCRRAPAAAAWGRVHDVERTARTLLGRPAEAERHVADMHARSPMTP